jgi:hypothetical protein
MVKPNVATVREVNTFYVMNGVLMFMISDLI